MKRRFFQMGCIVLLLALLAGCGSSVEAAPEGTIRMMFVSDLVNEENAQSYTETVKDRDAAILGATCQTVSLGNSSVDPAMYMASTMKVAGAVAAQEVDVIFYDKTAAARDARAEMFYAMEELFSEQELAAMEGRLIQYPLVDDEGNELEETTALCGLDVSGDSELEAILNASEIGIFVVGNAQNLEAVKALIRSYL